MASSSDDASGPFVPDLDRTTRVLARLQTEIARSRRQIAVIQRRQGWGPEPLEVSAPRPRLDRSSSGVDVLVVDDDHDLTLALSELLIESGYRVLTLHRVDDVIAFLRDHDPPPAIVLDLMMPERSGTALLEHLRTLPQPVSTEVIVFTAADRQFVRSHGIDPDRVVRKPDLPMLLERLALIG
jgi:CheY-like chemotaxis protein